MMSINPDQRLTKPVNQRGNENRERRVENRAPNRISREGEVCEAELRETEWSKGGKMCERGWRCAIVRLARIVERPGTKRERVGRRFWARRLCLRSKRFSQEGGGECVGLEGAGRGRWLPHPSRLTREQGGWRGSPLRCAYKRAQPSGKILSTVTRVSRCVKNSAAGDNIDRVVFRIVASSCAPLLIPCHPQYQFSRPLSLSLSIYLFTYSL